MTGKRLGAPLVWNGVVEMASTSRGEEASSFPPQALDSAGESREPGRAVGAADAGDVVVTRPDVDRQAASSPNSRTE